MNPIRILFIVITCLFIQNASYAADTKSKHVKASLIVRNAVVKPGDTAHVAVVFKIEKDWHIYWLNPGNSGMETKVIPALPKGYVLDGLVFPAPDRIVEEELVTFGYAKEAMIISTIIIPKNAKSGKQKIKFDINWLECKEICIPGKAVLTANIEIGTKTSAQSDDWLKIYNRYADRIPGATPDWKVSARMKDGLLHLEFGCKSGNCPKIQNFEIFPVDPGYYMYQKPVIKSSGKIYSTTIKLDEFRETDPKRFNALIYAPKGWGVQNVSKAFYVNVGIK